MKKHDIVQINPETPTFGGCFLVVTEVKDWGVMGYVSIPGGGEAYYRARHDQYEPVNAEAVWYVE